MRLALYQPDIAANSGTMLRLAACMGVAADIIEPCGFPFSASAFRRAAMDYPEHAQIEHHLTWAAFLERYRGLAAVDAVMAPRIILLSTKAARRYTDYIFRPDDILMVGQEGSGVPDDVRAVVDDAVLIPMAPGLRSLNVAIAGAMVLGEALRQTGLMPG